MTARCRLRQASHTEPKTYVFEVVEEVLFELVGGECGVAVVSDVSGQEGVEGGGAAHQFLGAGWKGVEGEIIAVVLWVWVYGRGGGEGMQRARKGSKAEEGRTRSWGGVEGVA